MTWRGRMKGYIIKVHAYRQLGDCRSPFDSVWRSFTRSFTQLSYVRPKEIRITHPTKYRPVFIRDKWNHPDGLESSTRAEWVEIPGLEATRKRIESVSQPDKQHTSSVG
jgi:ribosomal protein L32E